MSSSMEPLNLSAGDMQLRLHAHMTSAAAAGDGGGGNPHLSVHFHLITTAEDHTTHSERLSFNPPFSCIMDRHAWLQEVNSMSGCVVARVRSAHHSTLFRAFRVFCAYSKVTINRFLMLPGHAALFLSAEIEMPDSPPRRSLRAAVEIPRWHENLVTATFEGHEHGGGEEGGGGRGECAICLTDFVAADELHVMPCRHRFHSVCLREWLRRRRTCPICRLSLPGTDYTN